MRKSLLMILAVGFLAGGCSWPIDGSSPTDPNTVKLYLDPDGQLSSDRCTIAQDNFPALAKELGNRSVVIVPIGKDGKSVSFGQAAQTRDELMSAGVKRVTIALDNP